MATQTKILSFDEARRAHAASRLSTYAVTREASSRQRASSSARFRQSNTSISQEKRAHQRSHQQMYQQVRTQGSRKQEIRAQESRKQARTQAHTQESCVQTRVQTRVQASRKQATQKQASQKQASRSQRTREQDLRTQDSRVQEAHNQEKTSWFAQFKKTRAKTRADKKFQKHYGDEGKGSAAQTQAGPRAAVYKTEMGSSHRRAARMQNTSEQTPAKKRSFISCVSSAHSARLAAFAAIAACLVLACVYLYPAAQQYYFSVRECDRLQAEYDAIESRNDALESDVSLLSTDEGIEDRAHSELGWTKAGEHAVTVYGLDDIADDSSFTANIVAGSVKAPETWYSIWLDPIFGVQEE